MCIKDFVKQCIIDSFLGKQDEFKYANVFIEYVVNEHLEPMFLVVKECGIDPLMVEGIDSVSFPVNSYIKEFKDKWMVVMIDHMTKEVENKLEPTHLEVMLEEMRKKSFDIGKPKYKEEKDGR